MNGLMRAAALTAAALVGLPAVAAQDVYPSHSITLVVPFSAGGFTDVVARIVSQGLGKALGQSVVIENRPGAGATLGADLVAKSPPDGYRLLMIATTNVISGALYKNLPYDPVNSFEPIVKMVEAPYVLLVNTQVPATSVAELIALAKSQPGKLDFASSGNGSSQHMMAALFNSQAGIEANHVPYRGSGQAATDLVAGVIQYGFMGTPVAIQQTKSGRLRPLAVTSSKRSDQLPDVPTLAESGIPGYDASVWIGLVAPAGTSPAIIERLQIETAKVINAPEIRGSLAAAGVDPSVLGSEAFGALMESDRAKWAKVAKDTGAKVE